MPETANNIMNNNTKNEKELVLVVDFGGQYAQLIARRVREAGAYSQLVPFSITKEEVTAKNPNAIIFTGGPSDIYAEGAPRIDKEIFEIGVPILGICYGFQLIADEFGGEVDKAALGEYGRTTLKIENSNLSESCLLSGNNDGQNVWMSHGVAVNSCPEGFELTASTAGAPVAAFENSEKRICGVQWHPEVKHSENGQKIIVNFLKNIAGLKLNYNADSIIEEQIQLIKDQVGSKKVICGLSGGVDSAVAAALVSKAIGNQLICVFVDHGLLRDGEAKQVEEDFKNAFDVRLVVSNSQKEFLDALKDVSDPETKRKIIGEKFIRTFENEVSKLIESGEEIEFLVQGTLYPDVVESGGGAGAANIKSHHNVGGLPDDIKFSLVEPLRTLFKDEVRQIGRKLGVPEEIVSRQPFPGPGLAIRIIGSVDEEKLDILRRADRIVREELTNAGLDSEIWQCPVVLLSDVRSVGVQGDSRTYGHPIVLRPVSSEDAMTADWTRIPFEITAQISNRITNEVREINRVVLDVTSKPPGTIEWE